MLKERAEGSIGLHHCDGHTAVTCCWGGGFVAPPLYHPKKLNGKIIGHGTCHSQNSSGILSQSGTLFTKAYTYANQRHTVHTIYTHTETHSSTQTHE